MYKTKDTLFLVTFKHKTHHFVFTMTRVQHKAQKQLCSNAAQSPHVDGCCVWKSQDDLWSSIRGNTDTLFKVFLLESYRGIIWDVTNSLPVIEWLDLWAPLWIWHMTGQSKVNHFNLKRLVFVVHQHDVIKFDICVHDSNAPQEL